MREFLQTLGLFYRYVRPHRRQFLLGLVALFTVDLLNALPPLVLKNFIDYAAARTRTLQPYLFLGAVYATIALGQGVCRYLWRVLLLQASHKAAQQLREEYFAKLQRLPPSFYDHNPIGDLMALATNDVEAVRFAIGPGLLVFADACFLFVSLPPAMLWLSPKFTGLALAPMVGLPLFIIYVDRLIHARFKLVQEQFSKISSFAQENVEGVRVIKAFVREWTQLERFSNLGREFVRLNLRLAAAQSIFEPLFLLTMTAGLVSLFLFGGGDVVAGAVGIGTFVAFLRYLDNLAWPMMAFGMAATHYQRGKTSLARIREVLTAPEEPELPRQPVLSPTFLDDAPLLEARALTFAYPGASKPALKEVSFRIEHGSRTALVGPIGSGKSTLTRLISGQYDVTPGQLFFKGIDVTRLKLSERRELLAIVPQDTFLFSESLQWNVALGGSEGAEARVQDMLDRAGLAEESRLWGLDTHIGERGLNLSGGQRARVTLARALLRNVPLLVLDDALSSIDAQTESRILENLGKVAGESPAQALVMITHRFARLWKFDQLLVLREGELVQSGPPSQLALENGLYRQLLELQKMEEALA